MDRPPPGPACFRLRHPLAAVFLFSFALRIGWQLLTKSSVPVDDAAWYIAAAQRLFVDHAYTYQGTATAYWPVGYPFFLSLLMFLGPAAGAGIGLAQAALSSMTAVMIYDVVDGLRARPGSAWAAALAFAVFPSSLSLSSLYLSETLFAFLLFAAFWAALRRPGWIGVAICAAAISAACYVRPLALLLCPLPFGFLLLSGRVSAYFGKTAVVVAAILATAAPWAYRNYREFGGVCLYATNLGANLIIGHNPEATGLYMAPAILDSLEISYPNELERSHRLKAMAVAYAKAHPAREIRLLFVKAYHLLAHERTDVYASFVTGPERDFPWYARLLAVGNNLFYWIWLAVFLSVPFWRWRGAEPALPFLAAAVWVQIGFYCLFFAVDRYKFPALPFLFAVASERMLILCMRVVGIFKRWYGEPRKSA